MDSYSGIAIADLKDLAQKISVKSYGTKGDIINRLIKHAAGPSMLQTLAEKAQKEKTLKGKLKKKKAPEEETADKALNVQNQLPPDFCKDFHIKLVATKRDGNGVTTYTYVPIKPAAGPTKTISKKKLKEEKKKPKEKKPKKPATAYILFQKEERETMKQEGWTGDPKETMSECARRWKSTDSDTKSKFFALAKQAKEDYLAKINKAAAEKVIDMDAEEGDKFSPIDLVEDDEVDAEGKGEEEEEEEEDEEDGGGGGRRRRRGGRRGGGGGGEPRVQVFLQQAQEDLERRPSACQQEPQEVQACGSL